LRGAISFGEYYIDKENTIFLGYPAVEAHDAGISQDWSGAVLCNSAYNFVKLMLEDTDLQNEVLQKKANGEECKDCNRVCPFDLNEFLIEYKIPCKKSTLKGIALRWDDFAVRDLFGIGLENININSETGDIDDYHGIYRKVQTRFRAHNKDIKDDGIKKKIENTSKFIEYINNIYSKDFTMNKSRKFYIPHRIKYD